MKNLVLAVVVLALVVLVASPASAQSKMSISVGPDILLPLGSFGDNFSIGFGGTARGQYDFTPMMSAGLEVGYFTFSVKGDVPAGVDKPSFSAVPVRVFGKYYFMPEGKARFYGMFELGFWFSSVSVSYNVPGYGSGSQSASSTDFNYVPAVGVEIPAGKMKVDVSIRYDGVATSGGSSSFGGRVGLNFPI